MMFETKDLNRITDKELTRRMPLIADIELKVTHMSICHLAEFIRRKLFLKENCTSVYQYLTEKLKYSGNMAQRNIDAARLLIEIPEVAPHIEDGSINLTQVGVVQSAFRKTKDKEKKKKILDQIVNKTTAETQRIVAQELDIPPLQFEKQKVQQDESVRLEITLTKEQMELLRKCKDKFSNLDPFADWAKVIELAAKEALKEKPTEAPKRPTRSVTPKLKRFILQRDRHCQEPGCKSHHQLEVDHIQPQWAGGNHDPENLRAYCRVHNQARYREQASLRSRR